LGFQLYRSVILKGFKDKSIYILVVENKMTTIPKLPNDILFNIFHENKINKQNDIWKKRHNLMIKHFQEYCDELESEDEPSGTYLSPEHVKDDDIRCDVRFMDYNDAWNTSLGRLICDIHGGEEEVQDWCDNYY
jgi:hypothetical protein